MIKIKEDTKIGDIILEAGDKIRILKEGVGRLPYSLRMDHVKGISSDNTERRFSGHGGADFSGDIIDAGTDYNITRVFNHSDGSVAFTVVVITNMASYINTAWLAYDSVSLAKKDGWIL